MNKIHIKIFLVTVLVFFHSSLLACANEQSVSFEEKHKDKDYIFLEYSTVIKVNPDWSYREDEYQKIKILKEEGRSMGEIPLPYEKGRSRIAEFSAYTITPDGKKHKYTKAQDISLYDSFPVYSDSMVKNITMPEVNIGSTIELKDITESKGDPIKNAFWKEFHLLTGTPHKLIKLTIILPKKLNIQYKEFNLKHKPKITENHSTIIYAWEIHDVYDDSKAEGYIPPPKLEDAKDVVEFSSFKSWKEISDWCYGLLEKNLKITPEITQAAQKAIEGKTTLKDKVRAVLEYIQDNFRYVSMSFGSNVFEPHSADEVFKNKYGDCKDLALLCMAMFKVAGIESNIVLFRDESEITDPQFDLPMPALFDHVIVLVRDKKDGDFYVDPQLKGYDIGEYPPSYQNAYTFIITEGGGKFGRLPVFAERRNYTRKDENDIINSDGSALAETTSLWDLDFSINAREKLKALDNTEKEDFFKDLNASQADGGEVVERRWDNFDNRYGQIKSHLKVRKRDAYLVSDGLIVLDISGYQRDIEFTKDKRENPIFFSNNACDETITTYQIPRGFEVLSMPENIKKDIGFFSVERGYKREKDKIIIREVAKIKRLEVPKGDYAKVKEFFDKLPRDTYQRIVLKRTKSLWQEIKDAILTYREKKT